MFIKGGKKQLNTACTVFLILFVGLHRYSSSYRLPLAHAKG